MAIGRTISTLEILSRLPRRRSEPTPHQRGLATYIRGVPQAASPPPHPPGLSPPRHPPFWRGKNPKKNPPPAGKTVYCQKRDDVGGAFWGDGFPRLDLRREQRT